MEDTGRRNSVRIKTKLKVRFKDASAFISEYTHNISKGGIFVRTKKPCERGSAVQVTLVMPETDKEVVATGEVIHVVRPEQATEQQPAGMGVELKELSEEDRKLIEDFIHDKIETGEAKDGLGRRDHERYEAKIRVRFGSLEALKEEYTHNISHGGIFIRTNKPKEMHEKLRVILTHPETGEEMIMEGEVVRVVEAKEAEAANHPAGMGIKFLSMDKHTRAQLSSFINSPHVQSNQDVEIT